MTEARDIAGFALPFAAGTVSACLIPYAGLHTLSITSGMALTGLSACLLSGRFRYSPSVFQRAAIAAAAFFTGILCMIAGQATEMTSYDMKGPLAAVASGLCERFRNAIDSVPFRNAETPALLKALLTGDRSGMPAELTDAFRRSGASHILALSGMHLGMIYGIADRILSVSGNRVMTIRLRSLALLAVCGIYTIGTGASESMTRAFLFILLHEASKLLHRKTDLRQTLLAALVIQLASDPTAIRSAGFQLSYAAMAGIAYLHPFLKGFWPDDGSGRNLMKRIWESASLTISCQAATGPLAWFHFRSFPRHFLTTNLTAVPLTAALIPAALLTTALNAAGACPQALVSLTEMLASLMTGILKTVASL